MQFVSNSRVYFLAYRSYDEISFLDVFFLSFLVRDIVDTVNANRVLLTAIDCFPLYINARLENLMPRRCIGTCLFIRICCNISLSPPLTDVLSEFCPLTDNFLSAVSVSCSRDIYRQRRVLSSGHVHSVTLCITRCRACSYVHCSYASSVSGRSIKLKLTRPVRASEFPLSEYVRVYCVSHPHILILSWNWHLRSPFVLSMTHLWKHIDEIKITQSFINFNNTCTLLFLITLSKSYVTLIKILNLENLFMWILFIVNFKFRNSNICVIYFFYSYF